MFRPAERRQIQAGGHMETRSPAAIVAPNNPETIVGHRPNQLPTVENVAWRYQFGELIDAAPRERVSITRRGRTVAFVVSPVDLAELIDARQGRAAAVAAYDADLSPRSVRGAGHQHPRERGLAAGLPSAALRIALARFQVVTSEYTALELQDVFGRAKLDRYLSRTDRALFSRLDPPPRAPSGRG